VDPLTMCCHHGLSQGCVLCNCVSSLAAVVTNYHVVSKYVLDKSGSQV
jgi:hypothetical protein